jgi:pyroglutamyl-peptidase
MGQGRPKIVVTAFGPFQGRPVNGSLTVLKWLRRHWSPGFAASRILPVEWGRAPRIIRGMIERNRPRVCIALGEGHPGRVAIEQRAHNEAVGVDEAGESPPTDVINLQEAQWLSGSLGLPPELVAKCPWPAVLSEDAGRFLCNRVLWEIFDAAPPVCGFIHLPPQGATTDRDYVRGLGPWLWEYLQSLASK